MGDDQQVHEYHPGEHARQRRVLHAPEGVRPPTLTSWHFCGLQNSNTAGLNYHLVDARGQVVGRLASQLAVLLQVTSAPFCGGARHCNVSNGVAI